MNALKATDILLDERDDLKVVGRDLCIGASLTQEAEILLRLNQGELKNDPPLGPNLLQLVKEKPDEQAFKERVKIHFMRDGKDYHAIRQWIRERAQL